jgi:hypothetical protein
LHLFALYQEIDALQVIFKKYSMESTTYKRFGNL